MTKQINKHILNQYNSIDRIIEYPDNVANAAKYDYFYNDFIAGGTEYLVKISNVAINIDESVMIEYQNHITGIYTSQRFNANEALNFVIIDGVKNE